MGSGKRKNERKSSFYKKKKKGENLGGGEREGISYDSMCALRKKLIYDRKHLVSVLHKKVLKIENHYFWVCSEKTDF